MNNTSSSCIGNSLIKWARQTLVTVVLASASFAGATPATLHIEISKFAFDPKEVNVTPGTKVVWTNLDETPHTVTSKDSTFTSRGMDTDDTYEYKFEREGDFYYYCTLHPFMSGVVHVRKYRADH
jgi:plastocyanin